MKHVALTLVVLAAAVASVVAQKIDSETSDRTRIVHLKTALNHLTVIEVSEPVVEVAAGSPTFKVEWRENKVFIQPTEADASTNLFIWTASQRLSYELEPAGPVAKMYFAVDQAPIHNIGLPKPATAALEAPAQLSIAEWLLAGKPVRVQSSKQRPHKAVEVWISELYEKDGRVLIRYSVHNHSTQPYSINTPEVYQLDGLRYPQSLYGLVNFQLDEEQVTKLKSKRETPVRVLDGQLRSSRIAPGQEAVGVVTLQLASSTQPTVLRLEFPKAEQWKNGRQAQIVAFLVR